MRAPFLKASLLLLALSGVCVALCATIEARADEKILIGAEPGAPDPDSSQLTVPTPPGQAVVLEAAVYEDGSRDDQASASLEWHVQCPPQGPCAPEAFTVIEGGRGRSYQVPADFHVIKIVVSRAGTTENALFTLENEENAPKDNSQQGQAHARGAGNAPVSSGPSDPGPAAGPGSKRPGGWKGKCPGCRRQRPDQADAGDSGSAGGSSGASGGGSMGFVGTASAGDGMGIPSASAGSAERPGAKIDNGSVDAAYDRYYNEMPYPEGWSGASGSTTGQRGFNRSNVTPVVSCSPRRGADGAYHIECEEPAKKVLRVVAKKAAKPKVAPKAKKPAKPKAVAAARSKGSLVAAK